jgi:HSP20 family molecular chaperone IbpA
MKPKIRYSFPGRIYDLLLTDDKFLQEVSKLKKIENSFPRYDQWKDESGFHISFALAGYSQENLSITVQGRQILLSANGLEDITKAEVIPEDKPEDVDVDSDTYDKQVRTSVHKGYVSRGIARRSFRTQLYISEEFNLNGIKAKMEHGLLHIFVPETTIEERKVEIN